MKIPLLAALMICSSALAQTSPTLAGPIKKLCEASSYSWTNTTEFPGAPFKVSPIAGMTDTNGFVILKSEDGRNIAVAKGEARVLKTSSGWKTATSDSAKDPADQDLLNAKTPPDELAALTAKASDVKASGENSFTGTFDAATAKAYLQSSMKGRAPGGMSPEIENASGKFQLWLKDGLPQKYSLTINARISLPFGTKEVTRTSTTEIIDVGTTTIDVPMEAQQVLERANQ